MYTGLLQVLFTSSKAAKACAAKLHGTSKMGNIMEVFVDQLGEIEYITFSSGIVL